MNGLFLVIAGACLCGVSGILYLVGVDMHPEVAPAFLAFGAGLGLLGNKIP